MTEQITPIVTNVTSPVTYASFWKRSAAYLVDGLICGVIWIVILLTFGPLLLKILPSLIARKIIAFIIFIGIAMLYYVRAEASAKQATWGKRLFGLRVTDLNGQRISFGRSFIRILGLFLTRQVPGHEGLFISCVFTPKKQCWHDQFAKCLVLDSKPNEKNTVAIIVTIFFLVLVPMLIFGIRTRAKLATAPTENTHIIQAAVRLKEVHAAQHAYYEKHHRYATSWARLRFAPCAEEGSQTCYPGGLMLRLEKNGIEAMRAGGKMQYRLFLPYDSQDPNQDLTCTAQNEKSKEICSFLENTPIP